MHASRFINRELSWLEFNQRVLEEARDPAVPLLERLKFLAITASNLDEFFMVRVGGLQQLAAQGNTRPDPAGLTAAEQLEAIRERTRRMAADQYACFLDDIEPKLAAAGIKRVRREELTERQRRVLEEVFENELQAVLTPIAVTGEDDFPLLANQTLSVCVRLGPGGGLSRTGSPSRSCETTKRVPAGEGDGAEGRSRFAVIAFGRSSSRFVTLPSDGGYVYLPIEDVVAAFVDRFFPGEPIVECVPFRITRNADLALREDQAADLLEGMEEILDARKQSPCVRLEIADRVTAETLSFLREALGLDDRQIDALPGPVDLSAFAQLTELKGFDDLKYEPWPPRPSPDVDPAASMFDVISRRDVILYHPYESFDPVTRWIDEAADDRDVLAIKQTLYRTSRNSSIVEALARAAEKGKHVTAIVELKARFDEARNIEWARNLEQAGVQVIYGVKGLKTHAKICIVVRREPRGIRRYVHFGTGNYNESTARLYTDASFFTCNEDLGADAVNFFNAVTGYSQPQKFRKIEAAPIGLREKLIEMIEAETERKKHGQKAKIEAKLNSLVDPDIIDALYAASQAGVKVRLNVRGICCLRPGVKGLSENITVVSIIDRFLEHGRILCFHHGGDEKVFISSADWMPRNLDRRVELLVPVEDPACRDRLIHILRTNLQDTAKSWSLQPDGSYRRIRPKKGAQPLRSQEALYREVCDAVREAEQRQRTVFIPHRAAGSG